MNREIESDDSSKDMHAVNIRGCNPITTLYIGYNARTHDDNTDYNTDDVTAGGLVGQRGFHRGGFMKPGGVGRAAGGSWGDARCYIRTPFGLNNTPPQPLPYYDPVSRTRFC